MDAFGSPTEFIPKPGMTEKEKLDALTKFVVYAGILATIAFDKILYIYLTIACVIVIHMVRTTNPEMLGGFMPGHQGPTRDNPFMNVLLTDYRQNPDRSPAADIRDPAIASQVANHFNAGIASTDDVWGKGNSQRQFYTMPGTTIPNDRDSFTRWCWEK